MQDSSRIIYDECAYKHALKQSVAPVSYMLNPVKYEHTGKCRPDKGIVGGTNVSHVKGNLVDLESDLRGQTRKATKCAEDKYTPVENPIAFYDPFEHGNNHAAVLTTPMHLESCTKKM